MKALAALLAVLSLVACGKEAPKSGTVLKKAYDDPDTWTHMQPIFTQQCFPVTRTAFNGKTTTTYVTQQCNQVVSGHVPVQRHDGPHWKIRVRDDKDLDNVQWVEVSQAVYDSLVIGERWNGRKR